MGIAPIKIKIFGIDLFSKKVSKINKSISKVGNSVKRVGKTLTLAASIPALALGANILKTAGDFEASMNRVRALTGATGKSFESLQFQARDLGATTVFSAREAAGAQSFLAQAGFKTNQILSAMPATLNLAAAGQTELAETGDIVSNILTGYGKKAEETEKISDVLAQTFSSSNTNLIQLGEAFKLAGPVAASMNIKFNETATALGLMANAGFQASLGGTSLRGAMTRLLLPTGEAVKVFQKLKIPKKALIDSNGNLISLRNTLEVLKKSGAGATEVLEIFGQRAGPAMAAVLKQGLGEFDKLKAKIDGADSLNTATKIAKIQMEGFNGQLKSLGSAFDELKLAIGDSGVLKFMTGILKTLTSFTRNLAKTNPAFLKFGFIFLGLIAIIGPLLVVLGAVTAAIGAISLPVVLIIAGIALLTAGITFLILKWEAVMSWIRKMPSAILILLGPVGILLKGVQQLSDNWGNLLQVLKNAWQRFLKIRTLVLVLLGPLGLLAEIAVQVGKNWDKVVSVFTRLSNILGSILEKARSLASSSFAKISEFFGFGGEKEETTPRSESTTGGFNAQERVDGLFSNILGKLDNTLSRIEVKFDNEPKGLSVVTETGGANIEIERGLATGGL